MHRVISFLAHEIHILHKKACVSVYLSLLEVEIPSDDFHNFLDKKYCWKTDVAQIQKGYRKNP